MNSKTAQHLTKLYEAASPIERHTVAGETVERIWSHSSLPWDHIRDLILPIEKKRAVAAQAEEVRAAARERRCASNHYCGIGHKSPHSVEWHPYGGFSLILLDMCLPEIRAAVAADNSRRLAEYEAYRLACEQGVALPPALAT